MTQQIYLGTVLLERNRWSATDRRPSLRVSDWTERAAADGFDGLELWENHALLVDDDELERLRTGPCPVRIFNSYDTGEPKTHTQRQRIAQVAVRLGAQALKYNTGRDRSQHEVYIQAIAQWRDAFPPGFRLLCECHRGSTMDDPALAAACLDRLGSDAFGAILHGIDNDEQAVRLRFHHYGRYITHLHCNLSAKGLISEDVLRDRIALLRELGFAGTYTIEFTEGIRSEATIDELYNNAVRDLRLLRRGLAGD